MAIKHTIPTTTVQRLIQQVNQDADVSGDYRFIVRVEGGETHIGLSNKHCFECDAYTELLERRERERYPNVEGVE